MRMVKFYFLLLFISHSVFAQEITVHGKIRDTNTHREIPSVNIYIKGTQIGTSSDLNGRFSLDIIKPNPEMMVVFQHIAYDIREIALDSVKRLQNIYLQPRVIPLQGLTIEAPGASIEIKKDLPQAVSVLESKYFEIRGFTDAGDFLRRDHSVQVDEEISGKKTIAIRGGNPDEVVVLYNGIKMNSAFDNVFDLSLIDIEDIDRFEIIKGSNTALYGSGALSGIINVVPKFHQDYHLRFQQRVGTYRSGNWGIHLFQRLNRLRASYSFKQGATKRQFSNSLSSSEQLENRASHHTANMVYHFSEPKDGSAINSLAAMYIRSSLDYENHRDLEQLSNLNQVASLRYQGNIYWLKNLNLSGSYHQLYESQNLNLVSQVYFRRIYNNAFNFNVENRQFIHGMELLLAYQFESAELEFQDDRDFGYQFKILQNAQFQRRQHGFVAISKFHAPTGFDFMSSINFDISLRHDRVTDKQDARHIRFSSDSSEQNTTPGVFDSHVWNETMLKFATNFIGNPGDLSFNIYMNFGSNVKFPTLLQQISSPMLSAPTATNPDLNPEKNRSTELGVEITKNIQTHPTIYGWQLSGYFFKNYYDNKFRSFYTPGIPIAFYDNVQNAHITGAEAKSSIFLLRKKLTFEVGFSRYSISDKAAFPFRCDTKGTFDLKINHAGYAFQFHLFKEGEQVGWIREQSCDADFIEVTLPSQLNIDLHLGKTFEFGKIKLRMNASIRNLLNDDVQLAGLALRDRRFYLTMGIQY